MSELKRYKYPLTSHTMLLTEFYLCSDVDNRECDCTTRFKELEPTWKFCPYCGGKILTKGEK